MQKLWWFWALWIGLMASCASTQEQQPDEPSVEEVERIYGLYLNGRYEEYVDEMLSCDSMPTAYRQQMVYLHKQHACRQSENNRKAIRVTVERIETTTTRRQANVFLRVEYSDQSQDVVLLSMVRDGERWRLK